MIYYDTLRKVYKPKYAILTVVLGITYSFAFWYLAYIQGGNAVMLSVPIYMIFLLVASSSVLMTIAVYSMWSTHKNNSKAIGTVPSVGTIVLGSGLCGCTTTLLPTMALAVGMSTPAVYALTSFLRNYNMEIILLLITLNVVIIAYYLNKLSGPKRKIAKTP
jgi:hypothetical protein